MNKTLLGTIFREAGKGILTVGCTIAGIALTEKACHKVTGDEFTKIHHFVDKSGKQGAVVNGDTFLAKNATKVQLYKPK